jgi:hypothetical protein
MDPYYVSRPTRDSRWVELWAGYQLQFAGQRRQPWQEDLAVDLAAAIGALALTPEEPLAGEYATTDTHQCDVENRLFTNPGTKVTGQPQAIMFERSPEPPPAPPVPIALMDRHLHHYRYRPSDRWHWWEPDELLARWNRFPRHLADDGSALPTWLAMRLAAAQGGITVRAPEFVAGTVFGLRVVVHATPAGPRSAAAVSEPLIDGVVSAFHGRDVRPEVVTVLADRVTAKAPWVSHREVEEFVKTDGPGPLFTPSALTRSGGFSPADELCYAGAVTIRRDARGPVPEISGELFTLRRR